MLPAIPAIIKAYLIRKVTAYVVDKATDIVLEELTSKQILSKAIHDKPVKNGKDARLKPKQDFQGRS